MTGPVNSLSPFLPINQTYSTDADQRLIQHTLRDRDIARYVNQREISIYTTQQIVNGQQWFNPNNAQTFRNAFRKVFTFTAAGNIAHGLTGITQAIGMGQYTDGTNFYGVMQSSSVAIAGQVSFYVSPTNIVVLSGAGAPAITSGVLYIDYLLN